MSLIKQRKDDGSLAFDHVVVELSGVAALAGALLALLPAPPSHPRRPGTVPGRLQRRQNDSSCRLHREQWVCVPARKGYRGAVSVLSTLGCAEDQPSATRKAMGCGH